MANSIGDEVPLVGKPGSWVAATAGAPVVGKPTPTVKTPKTGDSLVAP